MQTLYAVDLDVAGVSDVAPEAALVGHLSNWLAYSSNNAPSTADLTRSGRATLTVRSGMHGAALEREAVWEHIGDDATHAIRLDLRQPLAAGHSYFVTRVTVSVREASTSAARVRVTMAREVTDGWLSPVPVEILRRPGIVHRVLADPDLRSTALGQAVDSRFLKIATSAELTPLLNAVRGSTRLPILLTRPQSDAGRTFAFEASKELAGLARVVCLTSRANFERFNAEIPEAAVPNGGARLVWPDLDNLLHPSYAADECEAPRPNLAQRIMRVLASLSVIARGVDTGWEESRRAAQSREADAAARSLREARSRGDQAAQLTLLEAEQTRLHAEIEQWVESHEAIDDELRLLKAIAGEAQELRYERDSWKNQFLELAAKKTVEPVRLDDAPGLGVGDARALFEFLEVASEGRLRFTENAYKSWRKTNYELPPKMREALIGFSRAAIEFGEIQGEIPMQLDEWFKVAHGLDVALTDQTLKKSGAADFSFEDQHFNGVPHMKVGDQTVASRCGRVHFAIDGDRGRFIVNHVGTHL